MTRFQGPSKSEGNTPSLGRQKKLRVLVLLTSAYFPPYPDELIVLNQRGEVPRVWPLDLPFDMHFLDQQALSAAPRWRRAVLGWLPTWAKQAAEAFFICGRYDVIFAWHAEMVALPLALMLRFTRRRIPFVALFGWVSPQKKAILLRAARRCFDAIILPPSVQRTYAVERLGLAREKVVSLPWGVDLEFWKASGREPDAVICAAGREMRDYETLIAALNGLPIRCHIAGAVVRGKKDRWRGSVGDRGEQFQMPPNVTMGPLSPIELRQLYDRSRFVVIPLLPSDTDNGITCMLEAWSMGRAVICSQVEGQQDALDHGRTGLFVPPGDVQALREAILRLWESPEEAKLMGIAGREYIEQHRDLRQFASRVGALIAGVVDHPQTAGGNLPGPTEQG